MVGEAAAGADQLDLEAAEQLIQLSGGDGDGGSESRSADSVKCRDREADQAQAGGVKEKEKEEAVESRLRRRSAGRFPAPAGKGGDNGGEPDRMSAAGSVDSKCSSRAVISAEEKGSKEDEEEPAVESWRIRSAAARFPSGKDGAAGVVVVDGEERRRGPRFRWLADIYRETRQPMTTRADLRVVGGNVHPEADDKRRKRKRAPDEDVIVVPVVSKESKKRTMARGVGSIASST